MEELHYSNRNIHNNITNLPLNNWKSLSWIELCVFGSSLIVPLLISSLCFIINNIPVNFSARFTRILAFPVSFSILCGFISYVGILGNSMIHYVESIFVCLVLIPVAIVFTKFYLPVYFNMEITHPLQYFQIRFGSGFRYIMALIIVFQSIIYVLLVLYTTSFLIMNVVGLDYRLISALTIFISIYTVCMGGNYGVIWINALQILFIIASLATIVAVGFCTSGTINWSSVTHLENFKFRTEGLINIFISMFGVYSMFISFYTTCYSCNTSILKLSSLTEAKFVGIANIVICICMMLLNFTLGTLLALDYNQVVPVLSDKDDSHSVLVPFYVKHISRRIPGVYGLFLFGIFSVSLSTIISTLSSIGELVSCDVIQHDRTIKYSERTKSFISNITSIFFGITSLLPILFAQELNEFMLTKALEFIGISFGVLLGATSLGMFFPWTNSLGSIAGIILSSGTTLYLFLLKIKDSGINLSSISLFHNSVGSFQEFKTSNDTSVHYKKMFENHTKGNYALLCCMNATLIIFLGNIFSIMFHKFQKKLVDVNCFNPIILKLWYKLLPNQTSKYIQMDEDTILFSPSFSFLINSKGSLNSKEDGSKYRNCDITLTPIYSSENSANWKQTKI